MKHIWNTLMACLFLSLITSCGGDNDNNDNKNNTDEQKIIQVFHKEISVPFSGGNTIVELKDDKTSNVFSAEISRVTGEEDWLKIAKTIDGESELRIDLSSSGIPTITLIIDENWKAEKRSAVLTLFDDLDISMKLYITQEAGLGSPRIDYTDVVQNYISENECY